MSEAIEEFFRNLADILTAASQSPLGIAALLVIALSFVSIAFFWREHPNYRLFAFLLLFGGAAALFWSIAESSKKPIDNASLEFHGLGLGSTRVSDFLDRFGVSRTSIISGSFKKGNTWELAPGRYDRVDVKIADNESELLEVSGFFQSGILTRFTAVNLSQMHSYDLAECNHDLAKFEAWFRANSSMTPEEYLDDGRWGYMKNEEVDSNTFVDARRAKTSTNYYEKFLIILSFVRRVEGYYQGSPLSFNDVPVEEMQNAGCYVYMSVSLRE